MNLHETTQILVILAANDNRSVDEMAIRVWQQDLADVDYRDAAAAVTQLRRETPNTYVNSGHIWRAAGAIRQEREKAAAHQQALARMRELDQAAGVTEPVDELTEQSPQVRALIASVAESLPQMTNLDRARARAIRERGRSYTPPPKGRARDKPRRVDYPNPMTDHAADMAAAYLSEGRDPSDVSERLGVSKRWCEREAGRLKRVAA